MPFDRNSTNVHSCCYILCFCALDENRTPNKMSGEEQKKFKTNRFTYMTAALGVVVVMLHNKSMRKFALQGVHKHALAALVGGYLGTKYGEWGEYQNAKRDYILNDYINRHPEDFKQPPVKLVGERLDKWIPIR